MIVSIWYNTKKRGGCHVFCTQQCTPFDRNQKKKKKLDLSLFFQKILVCVTIIRGSSVIMKQL